MKRGDQNSTERDQRKRLRALNHALRHASLFGEPLILVDRVGSMVEVRPLKFALDHSSCLVDFVTSGSVALGVADLQVEDAGTTCEVRGQVDAYGKHQYRFEFDPDAIDEQAFRATKMRRLASAPAPVPAEIRFLDGTTIAATAAVRGEEDEISEIELGALPPTDELIGTKLFLRETVTNDRVTEFDVVSVSGNRVRARYLTPSTTDRPSVFASGDQFPLSLKISNRAIQVEVETVLDDGVAGRLVEPVPWELPRQFLCNETLSGASLRAERRAGAKIRLTASPGSRVPWYNLLSTRLAGVETHFQVGDARRLSRLLQESRNYNDVALRLHRDIATFLERGFSSDQPFPSSRLRWLIRDESRRFVGHLVGVRASSRIWSAIDNVGSQSHPGRWNARVVSRWIRVFGEMLAGMPDAPLVQWNFSRDAGVWSGFHADLLRRPELVHCENAFGIIKLANSEPHRISYEHDAVPLTPSEAKRYSELLPESQQKLFEAVTAGAHGESSFRAAFERENGHTFARHYRLIRGATGDSYLVTFANHPLWESLNQGHNSHLVFPLSPSVSAIDLPEEVVELIRHQVFAAGCSPWSIMYFGGLAPPWLDLQLAPAAMGLAAEAAERF